MADRGYVDYSAPYFAEKERGRQQISQEAAYASAIAEQLGQYTPELQAQALRPLGHTPTVGESMIGAPIRGLGKLLGIESMQQVGAPRPFDIGQVQPQAAPQYPPLPEGTPPEMREALEGIAQQMGYTPQSEPTTIPSVPSEIVGKPRLMKTDKEWDRERRYSEKVWDVIMQEHQTKEERKMAEAKIAQIIQATQESQAREAEIQKRAARGIPPTEYSMIADHMGKTGDNLVETTKKLNEAKKSKPAALQIYDAVVAAGDFTGTFEQWTTIMNRAKWNPIDAAIKQFYANPWEVADIPIEQHAEVIFQMADNMRQAANKLDQSMLAERGRGLVEDVPIPKELLAQGITEVDITEDMETMGISRMQSIQKMMDYLRQQNKVRQGTTAAQPVAPVRK